MTATRVKLRPGMWLHFQLHSNRIVLEGFVQEVDAMGDRIRVGKTPDSPETQWHSLGEMTILKWQEW